MFFAVKNRPKKGIAKVWLQLAGRWQQQKTLLDMFSLDRFCTKLKIVLCSGLETSKARPFFKGLLKVKDWTDKTCLT